MFKNMENSVFEKIKNGTRVFKIIAVKDGIETPIDMVSTYEDYEQKLHTHMYTPLLYILDIPTRIAYLYGCLNREFNVPRTEIFRVLWRDIKTDTWMPWFEIYPYMDSKEEEN